MYMMERTMKELTKRSLSILLITALIFTMIPFSTFSEKVHGTTGDHYQLLLSGTHNYDMCQEMMTYINQARTEAGVGQLILDQELTDVAMQRAAEIAYLFAHTRPNRTTCYTACSSGRMYGENIAAGNPTAYYTHLQWMNSPGHKQNLLTSSYRSIGLGHFYHDGTHYWVQVFGRNVGYVETRTGSASKLRLIEIIENTIPLHFTGYGSSTTMYQGDSTRLVVGARNEGWGSGRCAFSSQSFNWSSSNPNVVSVDSEGNVQAVGVGKAIITATVIHGRNKASVSLSVEVKKDFYQVTVPDLPDVEYTGSQIRPQIKLTYKGTPLVEGRDYTVTYGENKQVGYGTVRLDGIGDYQGSRYLDFYINQKNIEKTAKLTLNSWSYGNQDEYTYLSNHLVVSLGGKILRLDEDYEIAYWDSRTDKKKITEYHVRFKGNYTGYRQAKGLDLAEFGYIGNQYYTGKAIKPAVTAYVKNNIYNAYAKALTEGVDYRIQWTNNVNAGTATVKLVPLGDNFGSAKTTFKIVYPPYTVKFNDNKGTALSKSKTVTYNQKYGTLPKASRKGYSFSGWYTKKSGGTKVTASKLYKQKGNQTLYAHWKKVTVKKAELKSLNKLSGKKLKVTAKTTTGAKGYQVVIATNSKFSKNKKTLTGTAKMKTFKNLKKAKYYVKVRAYKVDSSGNKVYGAYSKVKTVRIK